MVVVGRGENIAGRESDSHSNGRGTHTTDTNSMLVLFETPAGYALFKVWCQSSYEHSHTIAITLVVSLPAAMSISRNMLLFSVAREVLFHHTRRSDGISISHTPTVS